MKRGDFDAAIASFEAVCRHATRPADTVKAQMGLVQIYAKRRQGDAAIALCQQLARTPNPKAQAWAERTLDRLVRRFPNLAPNATGESSRQNSRQNTRKPTNDPIAAGFVPFDESPDTPTPPRELGFEPLDDASKLAESDRETPREVAFPVAAPAPVPAPPTSAPASPETPLEPESAISASVARNVSESASENVSESVAEQVSENASENTSENASREIPWDDRPCDRATTWRSLKAPPLDRLHAVEVLSAIALWIAVCLPVHGAMTATNEFLIETRLARPIQAFFLNHSTEIAVLLLLLTAASPWLLDGVLRLNSSNPATSRSFSLRKLGKTHPNTVQALRQYCRQHQLELPQLRRLPDDAPALFAYGHLPKTARLVLSQGAIARLSDDDLEPLLLAHLSHIRHRTTIAMSGAAALLQLPYTLYFHSSRLGDWLKHRANDESRTAIALLWNAGFWIAASVASLSYALFFIWRSPLLLLSRMRQDYGDRLSLNDSGHPNGLARSLLVLARERAAATRDRPDAAHLYQRWEFLMLLSYEPARIWGQAIAQRPPEAVLAWDLRSPYHAWFALNHSHPLLGHRLHRFSRCAEFWNLSPLLHWQESDPVRPKPRTPGLFRLQAAPFFGLAIGVGLAIGPAAIGWIDKVFDMRWVGWIYEDRMGFLAGLSMAGFAVGMLLRINPFFPDLKPSRCQSDPDWDKWLDNPQALPIDSQLVRLEGQLVGRGGTGNWLGQDLWLRRDGWEIPLHYCTKFGSIGNFLPQPLRPAEYLGRSVTVIGWFRRGATPWIDVDRLTFDRGGQTQSTPGNGHPIWATIVVLLLSVWGAYLIVRGG